MRYKLELNLEQMAMISKAISMWEQKDIKDKVRSFSIDTNSRENEEQWNILIQKVISKLGTENLPSITKSKLGGIVSAIGLKIFNWIKYIKQELHYGCDYTEQICWTKYGTIDKLVTFKAWIDNKKLTVSDLYKFACNYCLEEYTNNLWQQIPDQNKVKPFYNTKIYEEYDYHFVAYWKSYMDGNLDMLIKYFKRFGSDYKKIYDLNHSVEENMFRLSILNANELGVKYFWNRLNEEEKERNLKQSVISVLEKSNEHDITLKDSYIDIFAFLIEEMGKEERAGLFQEYKNAILRTYLLNWPWEELFMPTLEQMWYYFTAEDYKGLICDITSVMYENHKLNNDILTSRYTDILHEVWSKSPVRLKQTVNMERGAWNRVLSNLFAIEDIQSISIIINDQDIVSIRQELIDRGERKCYDLAENGKHELLEKFIQGVLLTEIERSSFKQKICERKINIFYDYICKDKYELVEKLLKWGFKTEEEQMVFKEAICKKGALEICYGFIYSGRHELAEKFFEWWGKTSEEKVLLKKDFIYKNEEWYSEEIGLIWCTTEDILAAKYKSEQFLNWCLDSQEEINLFKKEILGKKFAKKICDGLIYEDHFKVVENFLKWCLLSTDEIKQFKAMLISDTLWEKCDKLISNGDIDQASSFIDWCFNKEEEKQEFIKKFMSPSYSEHDPIRLCGLLIKASGYVAKYELKPTEEDKLKKFKGFINVWLESSEVREEFKNKFKTCVYNYYQNKGREVDVDHQIFIDLLENWDQVNEQIEVSSLGTVSDLSLI
ncbi:hypothetical protein [Rickettsia gravesii]|uniref:hypothetical protein n=1 Tax=Rickettsia gravesii TaxID=354585 RepID=UPI00036F54DA|nr:hypothetical protein [Rickettsia gravesii]